jgi:hypothetical protein
MTPSLAAGRNQAIDDALTAGAAILAGDRQQAASR